VRLITHRGGDAAYLYDASADGDRRRSPSLLPLQRSGLRLPAAAQSPAHTQAQHHVQHGHLGHHVPDCTGNRKRGKPLDVYKLKLREHGYLHTGHIQERGTYTLPGCPSKEYQSHLWNTCRPTWGGTGHALVHELNAQRIRKTLNWLKLLFFKEWKPLILELYNINCIDSTWPSGCSCRGRSSPARPAPWSAL